ncbi:MAG TPA: RHS repeat-associated core domain-containing protein [Chthoniobacterales bacterium]|nr:RHS repeat-associated core domain-containing protein [Chthoniobacterales bacterium]
MTYDRYPTGEVSRLIYPNGTVVNRNYTGRGQLSGVGWGNGSTSYAYWPDGKVDYQARTNGVTTRYGYDGRGMISSVLHEKDNQSLASREYWRDNRDRIVAWKRGTVNVPNVMETGRGDRYAYDAEGQLTQASYRALNPEPWLTLSDPKRSDSFQYDALGNRYGAAQVASRGPMTFTRRDNGLNQYQMWSPFSDLKYDDNWFSPWVPPGNGVTMADGYITASYNALNQPMAMGSTGLGGNFYWFWHDPLGRCVKRWLGNGSGAPTGPITYFYYDGWNLVQDGPNASTAVRLYVHGGRVDEIVASKLGGQWYHHQYDARGHCILLTDSTGTIQEQYDYDAFGMPYIYNAAGTSLGNSGGVGNRFLFTGREWLKDLRIYDYRYRHYQPELGRFLQLDPKQFEAGDYNLYRYCHNDPVNKSDPSGLVDLSYTPNNTKMADQLVWEPTYNPKEFFTIAGHGDENGIATAHGYVSISTILADMEKEGYKPGQPILLVVCESGRGSDPFADKFAKAVADKYKVKTDVLAPTTEFGVFERGKAPVVLPERDKNYTKTRQYDRNKKGDLIRFTATPKKKP